MLSGAVLPAEIDCTPQRTRLMRAGSSHLGSVLLLPFFATIGAAAGSFDALSDVGWMSCLIAIQLVTHVVVIICGGRLLRLPMDAVLTASNANVGGPATAAATAAVRKWPHLVQPAVLTGSLGCVLECNLCRGTPQGIACEYNLTITFADSRFTLMHAGTQLALLWVAALGGRSAHDLGTLLPAWTRGLPCHCAVRPQQGCL